MKMTIPPPIHPSTRSRPTSASSHVKRPSDFADTFHAQHPIRHQSHGLTESVSEKSWESEGYSNSYHSDVRSSTDTYASTIPSIEDFDKDLAPFEVPDDASLSGTDSALPSSPREFAAYFPSTRRITIKHDDSTLDGNMNLRLDTVANMSDGSKADLTLFHLRMRDLKRREFSLRRYCRDSGSEVCHSTRISHQTTYARRPGFQRSMSNALSSLRSKSENKSVTTASLATHDSGYDSMSDDDGQIDLRPQTPRQSDDALAQMNTVLLSFTNYAHLEVARRGSKSSVRYEFEYWGDRYIWRRAAKTSGSFREVSFHLVNTATGASIAHIIPVPLSPSESREEEAKGGYVKTVQSIGEKRLTMIIRWVPPCSMWISDEGVLNKPLDVAEYVPTFDSFPQNTG